MPLDASSYVTSSVAAVFVQPELVESVCCVLREAISSFLFPASWVMIAASVKLRKSMGKPS